MKAFIRRWLGIKEPDLFESPKPSLHDSEAMVRKVLCDALETDEACQIRSVNRLVILIRREAHKAALNATAHHVATLVNELAEGGIIKVQRASPTPRIGPLVLKSRNQKKRK